MVRLHHAPPNKTEFRKTKMRYLFHIATVTLDGRERLALHGIRQLVTIGTKLGPLKPKRKPAKPPARKKKMGG